MAGFSSSAEHPKPCVHRRKQQEGWVPHISRNRIPSPWEKTACCVLQPGVGSGAGIPVGGKPNVSGPDVGEQNRTACSRKGLLFSEPRTKLSPQKNVMKKYDQGDERKKSGMPSSNSSILFCHPVRFIVRKTQRPVTTSRSCYFGCGRPGELRAGQYRAASPRAVRAPWAVRAAWPAAPPWAQVINAEQWKSIPTHQTKPQQKNKNLPGIQGI